MFPFQLAGGLGGSSYFHSKHRGEQTLNLNQTLKVSLTNSSELVFFGGETTPSVFWRCETPQQCGCPVANLPLHHPQQDFSFYCFLGVFRASPRWKCSHYKQNLSQEAAAAGTGEVTATSCSPQCFLPWPPSPARGSPCIITNELICSCD